MFGRGRDEVCRRSVGKVGTIGSDAKSTWNEERGERRATSSDDIAVLREGGGGLVQRSTSEPWFAHTMCERSDGGWTILPNVPKRSEYIGEWKAGVRRHRG